VVGFVITVMNFAPHYVQGISGITEEGFCFMDSVC